MSDRLVFLRAQRLLVLLVRSPSASRRSVAIWLLLVSDGKGGPIQLAAISNIVAALFPVDGGGAARR
jgi:hypothetical protein